MALTDEEYLDWIYDSSRNQARELLIELDHSAGTLYFSALGWLSSSTSYIPYDDWIVGKPVIDDSLGDFLGVGDIDVVNMDHATVDWLALAFRGHECRWYFGDVAWPKTDFRQIASSTIAGCRLLTEYLYRFELLDRGQSLKRTFTGASATRSGNMKTLIDDVLTDGGLSAATYYNIDSNSLNMAMSIDVTEDSQVDATIKQLALSVGAYVRMSQTGGVEVYYPDNLVQPDIQLTRDNIGWQGMKMAEVRPAYRNVTVVKYDGTRLTGTTTAPTGEIDEELIYQTQLTDTSQATLIRNRLIDFHDTQHYLWTVPIFDLGGMIQVGDRIGVDHDNLLGNGTVERIKRSPLSPPFTYVDLLV